MLRVLAPLLLFGALVATANVGAMLARVPEDPRVAAVAAALAATIGSTVDLGGGAYRIESVDVKPGKDGGLGVTIKLRQVR